MFSKAIRRRHRRTLIITGVLAFFVIAIGAANLGIMSAAINPPEVLHGEAAIAALTNPDNIGEYVDIEGDSTIDTGLQWQRGTATKGTTEAYFVATVVQGRILVVKVDELTNATHFRGRLDNLDSTLKAKLVEGAPDAAELSRAFIPGTLDATTDWRALGFVTIAGCLVALSVLGFFAIRALRTMLQPQRDKHLRKLRPEDPQGLLNEIDQQLAATGATKITSAMATSNYLVTSSGRAVSKQDVVWVYPKKTTRKMYGVIPTGSSHTIEVATTAGKVVSGPGKPEIADLQHISSEIPWAYIGFDPAIAARWSAANRGAFIQEVQQRANAMLNAQGPPPSSDQPFAAPPASPEPSAPPAHPTPPGAFAPTPPGAFAPTPPPTAPPTAPPMAPPPSALPPWPPSDADTAHPEQ